MKTCSKCGASKPNADFKRADLTRDYTDCRACRYERRLELAKAKLASAVVPLRVTSNPWENLGLEFRNHKMRDPYSNSARHEGAVT